MPTRTLRIAAAYAYPLWERNKLRYCLGISALVGIAVAIHLVQLVWVREGLALLYGITLFGLISTAVGLLVWYMPNMPTGKVATFPKSALSLPVTDAESIFVPFLFGFVGFAIFWLALVATTLAPLGVPLWSPLTMAPARVDWVVFPLSCVAGYVAGSCLPQWVSGMKPGCGCGAVTLTMVPIFAPIAAAFGISQYILDPLCLTICIGSLYICAFAGPRARHGRAIVGRPGGTTKVRPKRPEPPLPPLKSPLGSQIWLLQGPGKIGVWFEPAATIVIGSVFLLFSRIGSVIEHSAHRWSPLGLPFQAWDLSVRPGSTIFIAGLPVLVLLFMALPDSTGMMVSGDSKLLLKPGLDRLTAIRPISTASAFGAKSFVLAKSALISSGFFLVAGMFLLGIEGTDGKTTGSIGSLIANRLGDHATSAVLMVALFSPVALWSLSLGSPLRYYLKPIALQVTGFIAIMTPSLLSVLTGFMSDPTGPDAPIDTTRFLEVSAYFVLAIKGLFAVRAFGEIRKRKLVSTRSLLTGAAIWLACAAAFSGALAWAFSPVLSARSVTAVVVLLFPINRILWNILGLDRSRHSQI